MSFVEEQALRAQEIEGKIKEFLPEECGYQSKVIEAMNYSMQAGGKRIRPMLMVETFKLCGGEGDVVWPLAVALEMVHNYSLVHDDLPCMDNDEYRRGRKTTHVVFGEGMATLAGDGLLNYAMEVALKAFDVEGMEPHKVSQAVRVLFRKSGIYGMI
ncbi:MAG: polyprenyl synthetase family protein, partial [Lachnospiraceae bacterium]|nr:polyprenyl synthetase family protein [Lachnospiraceae bacterium]